MQDKLYSIFRQKLFSIQQKTPAIYGAFRYEVQKAWGEYLDKLKVERQGKLLSMIITCPDDKIEFLDPIENERKIRIDKEYAIKIVTLGFIPEEEAT